MWKNCKIVMLPTDKIVENRMGYYVDGLSLFESQHPRGGKTLSVVRSLQGILIPNPQHLYILSDDEIIENDILPYMLCWPNGSFELCNSNNGIRASKLPYAKKIIATTDTSLEIARDIYSGSNHEIVGCILPTIPQSFIEKYITEYNKGHIISKVMVEYERFSLHYPNGKKVNEPSDIYKPKLNSNNTINIQLSKDSWTREEVITFCERAWDIGYENRDKIEEQGLYAQLVDFDEWIKQNL